MEQRGGGGDQPLPERRVDHEHVAAVVLVAEPQQFLRVGRVVDLVEALGVGVRQRPEPGDGRDHDDDRQQEQPAARGVRRPGLERGRHRARVEARAVTDRGLVDRRGDVLRAHTQLGERRRHAADRRVWCVSAGPGRGTGTPHQDAASGAVAGRLLLAATPIGNIDDASARLRTALATAPVVAAEDTRRLARLTSSLGVRPRAGWCRSSRATRRPACPGWSRR